ncbi:MAG: Flp pilus assembly protein TadD [Sphingobacteriales bacterium]|jgi:Flp pilus assembly protein TadD
MNLRPRVLFYISAGTLAVFVMVLNIFCGTSNPKNQPQTYLNLSDTAKYVGMETCRNCHSNIYDDFIKTGMGQSFDVASADKSAASVKSHKALYDKDLNLYYQPVWVDSQLIIKEFRIDGKDTTHLRMEKVDFIIGSGQHTNSHLQFTEGFLTQMPLTYYAQENHWDFPPGYKGNNTRFSRKIELECISCHNAYPEFETGSLNKYTKVPNGIDCERCHGPGSIHVNEKQKGNLVDTSKYIDYTIVNPKKLSFTLQVDVCQRCHLQGNTVLKPGKTFFDFKPGMKLNEVMTVFNPDYDDENTLIMASQAQRLQESKCFLESAKKNIRLAGWDNEPQFGKVTVPFTCVNCHNPHISVKETATIKYNATCKSCHSYEEKNSLPDCGEKLSLRMAKADNCVSCHMQKTGSIDIPHVSITDHQISLPRKREKVPEKSNYNRLIAINEVNASALTMAKGYLFYYEKFDPKQSLLDSAVFYIVKAKNQGENTLEEEVRLAYLSRNAKQILILSQNLAPSDVKNPWIAYYIGESYFGDGDMQQAERWFKKSCKVQPHNEDFKLKLGAVYLQKKDLQNAEKLFSELVNSNPKFAAGQNNYGYCLLMKNKMNTARIYFQKALNLNPDYSFAMANIALSYYLEGNETESKIWVEKTLKLDSKNNQALNIQAQMLR